MGDWRIGRPVEIAALDVALSLLNGFPEIELIAGLGTLRLMEVLPNVNILLIDLKTIRRVCM